MLVPTLATAATLKDSGERIIYDRIRVRSWYDLNLLRHVDLEVRIVSTRRPYWLEASKLMIWRKG